MEGGRRSATHTYVCMGNAAGVQWQHFLQKKKGLDIFFLWTRGSKYPPFYFTQHNAHTSLIAAGF